VYPSMTQCIRVCLPLHHDFHLIFAVCIDGEASLGHFSELCKVVCY